MNLLGKQEDTNQLLTTYNKYKNFKGNSRHEIDSDHYLLCAKVNFPPRWLSKATKRPH